ncbi:ISAs1 family transposase [Streptomyces sp. NPDC057486]|uniref:ISAs1 family transposase n=1 Tax=Streptomyces sp. NPDC057486 TaxID=3346145 RepID=UPI0036AC0BBA
MGPNAPQETLARLGATARGPLGVRRAPSTTTVQRLLTTVCPGGLADLLGCDPAGADHLAVDGKTAKGSRIGTASAAHLISALTGTGHVVSQARVPDKTTEVTALPRLLAPFDLAGVTVTADALHTNVGEARVLVEDKRAHYVLVVKRNQKTLFNALRALPWTTVRAEHVSRDRAHVRRETRSVRALIVTDLDPGFPYLVQAARIHRWRRVEANGKVSRETVYVITDLTSRQASPARIGQLARNHWTIENRDALWSVLQPSAGAADVPRPWSSQLEGLRSLVADVGAALGERSSHADVGRYVIWTAENFLRLKEQGWKIASAF